MTTTNKRPSTFRYYPLEPQHIPLLKAYKAELEAFREAREKLAAEFEERIQQLGEHHTSNYRSLSHELATAVGVDPEDSWGSPEYHVEMRYLENGFGAVTYTPPQPHSLSSLMGGRSVEELVINEPDDKVTRH